MALILSLIGGDGIEDAKGTLNGGSCTDPASRSGVRTITITGDNIIHFVCYNMDLTEFDVRDCPSLERLFIQDNLLTSLDVSVCSDLEWLVIAGNKFEADALNFLFESLPNYTVPDTGWIIILDNPGEDDCDTTKIPSGWTITDDW